MIFQLIDDHSRYAVASHVAWGETSEAAIAVVDKAHRRPRRAATTAVRQRGSRSTLPGAASLGQLVALRRRARRRGDHRQALQADHPGQERTLPPDPVPLPRQAAARRHPGELQAQVDAFDHIYNTERPHQGLPGRITPLAAWEATPKADPPRPQTGPARLDPSGRHPASPSPQPPADLPADTQRQNGEHRRHHQAGQGHLQGRRTPRPSNRSSSSATAPDGDKITVTDLQGEILAEHTRPAPGITLRRQRPTPRTRPKNPRNVTEVLTHQPSPMS